MSTHPVLSFEDLATLAWIAIQASNHNHHNPQTLAREAINNARFFQQELEQERAKP